MSMNVYITAERQVTFTKKNGQQGSDIQIKKFNAIQTPTKVTYDIIGSPDPIQAYKDWIRTQSSVEQEPVYAEDDIFGEQDPVGYKDYDWAVEHLNLFNQWLDEMDEQGYCVKVEVI